MSEVPRRYSASTQPTDLLHLTVLWTWDATVGDALGPFCPEHRAQLGYQPSMGLPVVHFGFDDKRLGASGWFVCPIDQRTGERGRSRVSPAATAVLDRADAT